MMEYENMTQEQIDGIRAGTHAADGRRFVTPIRSADEILDDLMTFIANNDIDMEINDLTAADSVELNVAWWAIKLEAEHACDRYRLAKGVGGL